MESLKSTLVPTNIILAVGTSLFISGTHSMNIFLQSF